MKIVTVCGNGCGTSLLLKMTVETALRSLGLDAQVEHTDLNSAASISCDFLMGAVDLSDLLAGTGQRFVTINSVLDVQEVAQAIRSML